MLIIGRQELDCQVSSLPTERAQSQVHSGHLFHQYSVVARYTAERLPCSVLIPASVPSRRTVSKSFGIHRNHSLWYYVHMVLLAVRPFPIRTEALSISAYNKHQIRRDPHLPHFQVLCKGKFGVFIREYVMIGTRTHPYLAPFLTKNNYEVFNRACRYSCKVLLTALLIAFLLDQQEPTPSCLNRCWELMPSVQRYDLSQPTETYIHLSSSQCHLDPRRIFL